MIAAGFGSLLFFYGLKPKHNTLIFIINSMKLAYLIFFALMFAFLQRMCYISIVKKTHTQIYTNGSAP